MPGAWAPSTSVSTPRSDRALHDLADREDESGRAGDVVDDRQPGSLGHGADHQVDRGLGARPGEGKLDDHDPGARAVGGRSQDVPNGVVAMVGGEDLVPGLELERSRDVLTPAVAFGTKTRSSASAPMKAPSAARASSRAGSRSRTKKATGSRSIRSRHASCAASTARGVAPNEPWFRNVMLGSSVQWRANSEGIGPVSYDRCRHCERPWRSCSTSTERWSTPCRRASTPGRRSSRSSSIPATLLRAGADDRDGRPAAGPRGCRRRRDGA